MKGKEADKITKGLEGMYFLLSAGSKRSVPVTMGVPPLGLPYWAVSTH